MFQAQIVPRFLNPRSDRSGANVNDVNGTKWFCPDAALPMFQQNVPANVTYEQKTSKQGKPYNVLVSVNGQPVGSGSLQQAGAYVPPALQAPPLPQQPPAQPAYGPAPPVQQPAPNLPPNHQAEEIFVTGVVGRAMTSGKFDIMDIRHLAKEATHAWRERNQPMPTGMPSSGPGNEPDDGWPGPDTENPAPSPLS